MQGVFFILALLGAVLYAQVEALASENLPHHSSQRCCGLCHSGPLPLIQANIAAIGAPVAALVWLPTAAAFVAPREAPLTAGDSRAPPA